MMKLLFVVLVTLGLAASVSALQCSGRGVWYPDTQECTCFQCFGGDQCQIDQSASCVVGATGGNPLLYQEYWAKVGQSNASSALEVADDYRTGYQMPSVITPTQPASQDGPWQALRSEIFALHRAVGNVEPTNYTIVLGSGCTGLIASATYALSKLNKLGSPTPLKVFAKPPYYFGYNKFASTGINGVEFTTSTALDARSVIEFNTVPNNPTGVMRTPVYPDSTNPIYDMVYNWPALVNTTQNLRGSVMLFSLSKLSGHAGTRFGWALVRDPDVANEMAEFNDIVAKHVSIDAQNRALHLLRHINNNRDEFFSFVSTRMQKRWKQLTDWAATGDNASRFSIQSVPGTFYAWIECKFATAKATCFDFFLTNGIRTEPGASFGVPGGKFVRIELVQYDVDFDLLVKKLSAIH
eukprot:TRINITY_DN59114_c0_g1_i2.p2 TRINITY_DN59114_c0_g1~~TRINITY_DN59114_c0_g1_i2.p2  ORF type:complete len:410 (-),score=192.70 TRINITY_DN59114_c0_g1_i2:2016-3245(-)